MAPLPSRVMAFTILACLVCGALAAKSRVLIIAGDGYSDRGNLYAVTSDGGGQGIPDADVYYNGSFTNAPGVWAKQIDRDDTIVAVRDLAYGGARACDYPELPGYTGSLARILSLKQQVAGFKEKLADKGYYEKLVGTNRTVIPLIWAGHDDLFVYSNLSKQNTTQLAGRIVGCIQNASQEFLEEKIFKHLILTTLAPIDLSPYAIDNKMTRQLRTLITAINTGIKKLAADLSKRNSTVDVIVWDANAAMTKTLRNWKKNGYDFWFTPCINTNNSLSLSAGDKCKDPERHLFYDSFHPEAGVHTALVRDLEKVMIKAEILTSIKTGGGSSSGGGSGGGSKAGGSGKA